MTNDHMPQPIDIPKRGHSMINAMFPGIIFGLIYGMITMFPEWLFYTSDNSALSIGSFLNLPAIIFISEIIQLPENILNPLYLHYLVLSLVLLIDATFCGFFSYIVRIHFQWKDRRIAFLLLFCLFYFLLTFLVVIL
jgi:hypothetical protein